MTEHDARADMLDVNAFKIKSSEHYVCDYRMVHVVLNVSYLTGSDGKYFFSILLKVSVFLQLKTVN